jgi:cell division septation protein DedD
VNEKPVSSWPHATVLVVAAETPEQRAWAVEQVLERVRELAETQPKVVLVDLLPGEGSLPSVLKVTGGPGIVDVFFRGAAFSTIARRPESETFFFLPVGSAPPPREVLYRHPGWAKVSSRLAAASAYLLPCVTARHWSEAGPIAGFESCVVFNGVGHDIELPEGTLQLAEYRMETEPERVDERETALEEADFVESISRPVLEAEPATEPEPATSWDDRGPAAPESQAEPEDWGAEREAAQAGASEWPSQSADARAASDFFRNFGQEPASVSRRGRPLVAPGGSSKTRFGRRRVIGPIVAGLAVAVLAFALWRAWQDGFFVREQPLTEGAAPQQAPGDEPAEAAGAGEAEVTAQPAAPTGEEEVGEPLRPSAVRETPLVFSVAVASYPSLEDAIAHQRRIERPDLTVYVSPSPVRGTLWYRVLAGLLETRAEADQLMRALVGDGIKREANTWDIRPTRLAFQIGVYPTSSDAGATLETLEGLGIPAYVVPAPPMAANQDRAYHVYVGGYQTPEEAQPMQERITRAGLQAELVERVGLTTR